jgi:hypothetical protein
MKLIDSRSDKKIPWKGWSNEIALFDSTDTKVVRILDSYYEEEGELRVQYHRWMKRKVKNDYIGLNEYDVWMIDGRETI